MGEDVVPARQHANLDGLPLLITVPRAADLLGISRSAGYRCAATGELPTTRLGGRVYVVTGRLMSLLDGTNTEVKAVLRRV
jgi:excisionase family DNA binding protein